jgi:hypothetical protein
MDSTASLFELHSEPDPNTFMLIKVNNNDCSEFSLFVSLSVNCEECMKISLHVILGMHQMNGMIGICVIV